MCRLGREPILAQPKSRASADMHMLAHPQQGQKCCQVPGKADSADEAVHGQLLVMPVGVALQGLQGQILGHDLHAAGRFPQTGVGGPRPLTMKQGQSLKAAQEEIE